MIIRSTVSLVLALAVTAPAAARAGGSLLLDETFQNASIVDPGFLPLDSVCLTGASGPPPAGQSPTGACLAEDQIVQPVPPPGVVPGYLQLTDRGNYRVGGLLYNRPLPGNGGLVVSFDQFQYGGNGADGIGFFLVDGSVNLTKAGADGGSLGYAQRNLNPGVDGGYLGVGLDAYGNFANDAENRGMNCPAGQRSPTISDYQVTNTVTLRGPGQGLDGYCFLASTMKPDAGQLSGYVTTLPGSLRGPDQTPDTARRTVRITLSPDAKPLVTVEIDFHDGNGMQEVLSHQMTEPAPPTYKFGFSGSTGGLIDTHLIRGLRQMSVNSLPQINLVKSLAAPHSRLRDARYAVGDVVDYEFLVTNTGDTPLTGVKVTDPEIGDLSCPRTVLSHMGTPGASMVCTGSHTITIEDSFTGRFTSTARASGTDGKGHDATSDPSSVTVPVDRLDPTLRVGKSVSAAQVKPGGSVTYTVTATNASGFPIKGVELTDDLSDVLAHASLSGTPSASTGAVTVAGDELRWKGDLADGATVTIAYTVKFGAGSAGTTSVNSVTASIPGATCTTNASGRLPCTTSVRVPSPPRPPKPPHKPGKKHKKKKPPRACRLADRPEAC